MEGAAAAPEKTTATAPRAIMRFMLRTLDSRSPTETGLATISHCGWPQSSVVAKTTLAGGESFRDPEMRIAAAATAMVASALALLDCSGGGGSASKAGGADGPVTLRLATDDEPTSPPALQAKEFARRVNERSRGRLRVEVVTDAVKPDSDYERLLVKTVTSATLDLGLFESRSWDRVGVTSLNALEAPFLVTTDALVAAVIGGGEGRDMLAGLERAGVVGLALLPDVLEHPFGPDRPLLGPDDYAGGVIPGTKTRPYTTVSGALGATVEQEQGLHRRRHIGGVGGYNQQGSGIFTGNVTFFPKTNALAINARAYERLDADVRSVLSEAAAATRDWAIATTPTDPERARSYCTRNDATAGPSRLRAAPTSPRCKLLWHRCTPSSSGTQRPSA